MQRGILTGEVVGRARLLAHVAGVPRRRDIHGGLPAGGELD